MITKAGPGVWHGAGPGFFFARDEAGNRYFLMGQGDGRGVVVKSGDNGFETIKGPNDPLPPNAGLPPPGSGSDDGWVKWARDGGLVGQNGVRGAGKAIRGRGKGKMV